MSSPNDASEGPPDTREFVERRKYPRRRAAADIALTIPTVVNAEVLDISAGGALVSTPAFVPPGNRCQLRTLLDREPFAAFAEVLRATEGTRAGNETLYHLGLKFGGLDHTSRRTLLRFVKDQSEPR